MTSRSSPLSFQSDREVQSWKWKTIPGIATTVTIILAAAFLFTRLGHYALWDDEANTALIGEGVWQTGDTSAVVGHNLVAYRGGVELSHLKERYLPPLQYYVVAPFVGLWPRDAGMARLPFALIGLISIALVFFWLWLENAAPLIFVLTAMALIGNTSLWLYLRQCRYYSLSIFFSLAIVYIYFSAKRRPWTFVILALLSIGLLASNYLNYAALYGALAIDWFIWSKRRFPIGSRDALWLFIPQLVIGGFIICTWNPLHKNVFGGDGTAFAERLRLFWWAWRDLNRCEFGSIAILAAAPLVAYWRRDRLLMRASLALFCYLLVIVFMTPQNPALPMNSVLQPIRIFDVRYLAPAIPLIIAIGVLTIERLFPGQRWWPAILAGVFAFETNILNGGSLVGNDARDKPAPMVHSAVLLYARELVHPGSDPYTLTADWINANVSVEQTVWILPDYMTYPLMFHAPQAIYAWQLPRNAAADLRNLNPAFYKGQLLPNYLICAGPDALRIFHAIAFPSSVRVRRVATIDFYWHDLYRPELAWRTFSPVTDYQRQSEDIQIFRLQSPTAASNE